MEKWGWMDDGEVRMNGWWRSEDGWMMEKWGWMYDREVRMGGWWRSEDGWMMEKWGWMDDGEVRMDGWWRSEDGWMMEKCIMESPPVRVHLFLLCIICEKLVSLITIIILLKRIMLKASVTQYISTVFLSPLKILMITRMYISWRKCEMVLAKNTTRLLG